MEFSHLSIPNILSHLNIVATYTFNQSALSCLYLWFCLWQLHFLFWLLDVLRASYVSNKRRSVARISLLSLNPSYFPQGMELMYVRPLVLLGIAYIAYLDYFNLCQISLIVRDWIGLYGIALALADLLGSFESVVGLQSALFLACFVDQVPG